MGMIGPLFGIMQSISMGYAAQGRMMGAQNAMLRMAGNPFIGSAAGMRFGAGLEIQNEMDKVTFASASAMRDYYTQQLARYFKQQERENKIWFG